MKKRRSVLHTSPTLDLETCRIRSVEQALTILELQEKLGKMHQQAERTAEFLNILLELGENYPQYAVISRLCKLVYGKLK